MGYYIRMGAYLMRMTRFSLLVAAGIVVSVVAITIATTPKGKNTLWHYTGASAHTTTLATSASCAVPQEDTSDDVYFVSCGGFY